MKDYQNTNMIFRKFQINKMHLNLNEFNNVPSFIRIICIEMKYKSM